jgi:hypothetical protein
MMPFENLTTKEHESLLMFPAYISLLAANADGKLDENEESSAVDFAHIKTYSSDPLLVDFFNDVHQTFSIILNTLNKALPLGKINRDSAIKKKLFELEAIVNKLDQNHAAIIRKSMWSFKEHVSRAHHNVLLDFIIPFSIKGLNS